MSSQTEASGKQVAPTERLLVVDGYFHWPPGGGGIRDIAEVANGLSAEYEVVLLAPRYGFRGWIGYRKGLKFEVKTIPFDKVDFSAPTVLRRFRSAIRRIDPDLVLVGNGNAMKPFMIIACEGYKTFVRLYSYELLCPVSHGLLFNSNRVCDSDFLADPIRCVGCLLRHPQRSVYDREALRGFVVSYPTHKRAIQRCLASPEAFIVTSRYMRRRYSPSIEPERLAMIPSGLDCSRFAPGESNDHDTVTIFSAGRVDDPAKGLPTLVDASELLWKKRKDFRLRIAGRGMKARADLPFLVDAGWISERKLPSAYVSSDIVVVPSIWAEPFGMVALEAMGCGKPVVASKVGGLTDFIMHGRNGYHFPPGRADELCQALEDLVESPRRRKRFGRAARNKALQYDWPRVIPRYLELLSC